MPTLDDVDLIVVGAGFYGMTVAERAASEGFRVLVLERRNHIGGNAYTYIDTGTGIEVHKYGAHLFHTSNREVFEYLSQFTEWVPYEHRVWTIFNGCVYPLPINLATICLYNRRAMSPATAQAWVAETARGMAEPRNFEEKAISLVGRPLYEAFIRGYTAKQWQTDPTRLPAEIITRLPVRYNFDGRYFNDEYQYMPKEGYTALFERMRARGRIAVSAKHRCGLHGSGRPVL
jgi:UDP-galactopyranose mutase